MKHATLKTMGLALALSGPLFLAPVAAAVAAEAEAKTAIPETADAILLAIDTKSAELKKTIDSGALDEVHHQAFAIRDLVAALPAKSASLPADKLAKIRGNVKFVATLAERLDTTGDAKDMAGTKSNYAKLTTVLASIHSNYTSAK
jgi:hypothetical protein